MGQRSKQRYCPNHGKVLAVQETPNHILHLILSLITGGLWLIVWIVLLMKGSPLRCPACGSVTSGAPFRKAAAGSPPLGPTS